MPLNHELGASDATKPPRVTARKRWQQSKYCDSLFCKNCHPHRQKLETPLTPSQLFLSHTELSSHSYYNYGKQVITVCGKACLLGFWDCALPAPSTYRRTQLYSPVK